VAATLWRVPLSPSLPLAPAQRSDAPATTRIAEFPALEFLVIVNPDSGPGSTPLPSADYVREIPKLNASANVVTLGYIRVHYCDKPLREVYAEVDAYTGWAGHLERAVLGMRGVFVDETPNHYSPERASYLDAVRQHIKVSPGIVGDKLVSS